MAKFLVEEQCGTVVYIDEDGIDHPGSWTWEHVLASVDRSYSTDVTRHHALIGALGVYLPSPIIGGDIWMQIRMAPYELLAYLAYDLQNKAVATSAPHSADRDTALAAEADLSAVEARRDQPDPDPTALTLEYGRIAERLLSTIAWSDA